MLSSNNLRELGILNNVENERQKISKGDFYTFLLIIQSSKRFFPLYTTLQEKKIVFLHQKNPFISGLSLNIQVRLK